MQSNIKKSYHTFEIDSNWLLCSTKWCLKSSVFDLSNLFVDLLVSTISVGYLFLYGYREVQQTIQQTTDIDSVALIWKKEFP